jgi:mRNA interferase MazF
LVIRQGDVCWLSFGLPQGSAPGGRRPALVVQHDRFNRSAIATTVVVAITSTARLGDMPGNVRLRRGEAGLPRPSVVNVSQIRTIDRTQLGARIGSVSATRMTEILRGLSLLLGTEPAEEASV